ncbi:MAG: DUF1929 domain-containing protein [Euryarchaeota archaeon]|nr:DUF1929 domain-containing protein [Euryarchaeota archaeon]
MVTATMAAGCAGKSQPQTTPDEANGRDPSAAWTAPSDPTFAVQGRWLKPMDGNLSAIHAALMPDGRLVYWSGLHFHGPQGFIEEGSGRAQTRVLTINGTETLVENGSPGHGGGNDLFCAGQVVLMDGTVLAAGGAVFSGWRGFWYGSKDTRLFNPATNAWTMVGKMEFARWYPSVLTLPDGKALVASGIEYDLVPGTMVKPLEVYDPAKRDWQRLPASADANLPMYPRLFAVPSGPLKGDVFYQPGGCLWCPGGAEAEEIAWNYGASLNLSTNRWTQHAGAVLGMRQNPITVMLPLEPPAYKAEIFTASGTLNRMGLATDTTEFTDLSADTPRHYLGTPLRDGRWFAQHVLLPDGQVLIAGGSKTDGVLLLNSDSEPPGFKNEVTPVMRAELYDPEGQGVDALGQRVRGASKPAGSIAMPRVYHASALLLPDGRVFLGGSSPPLGTFDTSFELYEPPYLFWGPRPAIDAAPTNLTYAQTFDVRSKEADEVVRAVLVKPGAVTHVYNPEQRLVELAIRSGAGGVLTLESPPDAAVAPPGNWMLFILTKTDKGLVPSVAHMVHVAP